jgi:hypothetical protein
VVWGLRVIPQRKIRVLHLPEVEPGHLFFLFLLFFLLLLLLLLHRLINLCKE